ncbi:flotillin domain protein [Trichodelitschia bisporula]|uniref:Flotillin domain protein n=1 Tax=Trichodelitschia bisporula TaxID=703511 RepID=A0A6G1I2X3_9PEZI|nr:flotillin domain protein [Trichodelitschia bisporula]
MWYHVAEPSAYLAITGLGISNVTIRKKSVLFPFQKVSKFTITPFDFSMSLQAMTVEKLNFSLPAVFTIGPDDEPAALLKYAVLLTGGASGRDGTASKSTVTVGEGRKHVQDIVKGIIEGETRSIVSTMTMEELFKERRVFRDKIIKNIQSELDQFGLKIYNANVKELQDTPGSEYFAYLSRKAHEGALNQAKVDVADARMRGDVGEAEKQGKTKQEVAKIHAATAVLETERKAEKAAADAALADKEIHIAKNLNLSKIAASRAAETRDAELAKVVEQRRGEMQLEKLRADTVTKAVIARESEAQAAMATLYATEQAAAGTKATAQADADAAYYRTTRAADAALYAAQQEAAGVAEMARGYAALADVMGGPAGLLQYLMMREGTFERLADANARAVQGLQPKISVWNTGSGAGEADAGAPLRNLYQSLPPLLETVREQTGITPPTWLVGMPPVEGGQQGGKTETKALSGPNGTK